VGDAWQMWATPGAGTNLSALQFDWYYDWSAGYLPERSGDSRYARMVWCQGLAQGDVQGGSRSIAEIAAEDFLANRRGRVWLIYNEPDDPNQCGGAPADDGRPVYANPTFMARHFAQVYDLIKAADPYAQVFAGGLAWISSPTTRDWWRQFVGTLAAEGNLPKLEGVHIHLYPFVSTSSAWNAADSACFAEAYCAPALARAADAWYRDMHAGLGLADRPIWITEAGWLYCGSAYPGLTADHIMRPLAQWFGGDPAWPYGDRAPANPGYDAIAWYVTHDPGWFPCTHLLSGAGPGGTATDLGRFWSRFGSPVEEVGPGVE
jgi:hypothetical protein